MPSILIDSLSETVLPHFYVEKILVERVTTGETNPAPTVVYASGKTNYGRAITFSDNYTLTHGKSSRRVNLKSFLLLNSQTVSKYLKDNIVYVCAILCRNREARSYLESGLFSFSQLNDLILKGSIEFKAIPFKEFYQNSKKDLLTVTTKTGSRRSTGLNKYSYEFKLPLTASDGKTRESEISVFTFVMLTDRKINNGNSLVTFPLFGHSYGPMIGNLVIRGLNSLNTIFYTLNDIKNDIWAGSYHKDIEEISGNSYLTGLTSSGRKELHKKLKLNLIPLKKVIDQTVLESIDDTVPPLIAVTPSVNVATQRRSPGFLNPRSLNETKIFKNIGLISPLYTSIDQTGIASTIFHIDKKNILKTNSKFSTYLSSITDPITLNQIYSSTLVKNIKITREHNGISEIVGVYQFGRDLNYLEKVIYSTKIRNSKENNTVFSTLQKINTFEQNSSMNSYAFKDYFINSSLRDKFIYRIELTIEDGYEKVLESKYITFLKECEYFKNIYDFLNVRGLFYRDGKLNETNIDKISPSSLKSSVGFSYGVNISTTNQINMKLRYIIASYLDLLMLINQSAVPDPEGFINSIMSFLSIEDGNIKQYENIINKFDNFKKNVSSTLRLSLTLQTDQRVVDSSPKLRKENKDSSIMVQTYSDFVFAKTKDTTLIENISGIKNDDSVVFPELNLPELVFNAIDGTGTPNKIYVDNLYYEISGNYSEKFILFHNQSKGLDTDPTKVGIYSPQDTDITKNELASRKRILDALGSTGISVIGTTSNSRESTNRSLIESSVYLNNFNTPEEVTRDSNININNSIDLNFPLDLSSVVAKRFMTPNRNVYSTKSINEYAKIFFTEMLKYKIQILKPYANSNDALVETQFTEQWVDLNQSTLSELESNRNLLARTVIEGGDLTNLSVKDNLNFSHVNQYFVIKSQELNNLINIAPQDTVAGAYGPIPFNPYLSQIFTAPEQIHNIVGINSLYVANYNKLQNMFSFSVAVSQPKQAIIFGTNFDPLINQEPVYASTFGNGTENRRIQESEKESNVLESLNPQIKKDGIIKRGLVPNTQNNPTTKLGY